MAGRSAGLLMYRVREGVIQVFLAHPGGPFFAKKDDGAWTVPKGEYGEFEDPLQAAIREFREETGLSEPADEAMLIPLGSVMQKNGKHVTAWAFEASASCAEVPVTHSNEFEMEWPPRSGKKKSFPEVDRGEFIEIHEAVKKINPAQAAFLERLPLALTS